MTSADFSQSTPAETLRPYSTPQLLNLVVGLIGIQFAWSMQIALTNQVVEPLGANPLLKGIIWCAGPLTGLLVQPVIGALSDNTWTFFGRRRPFILVGALLGAVALLVFPHSPTLLVAGAMIWIIDACVNVSQGPYRALIPDNLPPSQTTVGNSYMNAAIAVGSVISLGLPPLLALAGLQMSIADQFLMASIALILTIFYTCLTVREIKPKPTSNTLSHSDTPQDIPLPTPHTWLQAMTDFRHSDPEVFKLCGVQFLTWVGVMCLFINLTDFVVHNVFDLPAITPALLKHSPQLSALHQQALNTAQSSLALFNLSSLILTVPLGVLSNKIGRKQVHGIALLCMVLALATAPFLTAGWQVLAMMTLAGVAWATILSIPFAILADYIPPGKEGSLLGIFNMFVALPQLISALGVGALVDHLQVTTRYGPTNPYWLALVIGAGSILLAILLLQRLKEKPKAA